MPYKMAMSEYTYTVSWFCVQVYCKLVLCTAVLQTNLWNGKVQGTGKNFTLTEHYTL